LKRTNEQRAVNRRGENSKLRQLMRQGWWKRLVLDNSLAQQYFILSIKKGIYFFYTWSRLFVREEIERYFEAK
jgi:hypothetical protein